jgi:hypothetical protein
VSAAVHKPILSGNIYLLVKEEAEIILGRGEEEDDCSLSDGFHVGSDLLVSFEVEVSYSNSCSDEDKERHATVTSSLGLFCDVGFNTL